MSQTNQILKPKVAVIMGSDSDWRVMKKAKETLEKFDVGCLARVVSAHRTPEDLSTFAQEAETSGIQVIIAGAGGAAHLPGMLASYTQLPVIGVPILSSLTHGLNGLDSLLSIVQMPEGIPVATVAIENAGNGALLALRILALQNLTLRARLDAFRTSMAEASRKKTENLK